MMHWVGTVCQWQSSIIIIIAITFQLYFTPVVSYLLSGTYLCSQGETLQFEETNFPHPTGNFVETLVISQRIKSNNTCFVPRKLCASCLGFSSSIYSRRPSYDPSESHSRILTILTQSHWFPHRMYRYNHGETWYISGLGESSCRGTPITRISLSASQKPSAVDYGSTGTFLSVKKAVNYTMVDCDWKVCQLHSKQYFKAYIGV